MLQLSRLGAAVGATVLACLVVADGARAQTVTLQLGAPYMWGGGGEFNVTASSFAAPPLSLTLDGNFQSFCWQSQVPISLGETYDAFFAPGLPPLPPGGPALTPQTAYLYHLFITRSLPQYDYNNTVAGGTRKVDAGALQFALWELTGQSTAGLLFNPQPAKTTFFKNLANTNAAAGNYYGVSILVVYDGPAQNPTYQQALLIKVPAPGGAAVLGLGGLLAARRRRAVV